MQAYVCASFVMQSLNIMVSLLCAPQIRIVVKLLAKETST